MFYLKHFEFPCCWNVLYKETCIALWICDILLYNVIMNWCIFLFFLLFRCPEMSVASERIFTQDRIKQDCSLFPGLQVVCKCKCHQLLVYFLSKTNCVPLICIFILSENQVSLMFSEKSKTPHVRICYVQVCMYTYIISDNVYKL